MPVWSSKLEHRFEELISLEIGLDEKENKKLIENNDNALETLDLFSDLNVDLLID